MPSARYWRIVGIQTQAGGDLELGALHLHGTSGRIDDTATLTCSHSPIAGTLADLQDSDTATHVRFAAADVRSPSFWLQWDFGSAVEVVGPRLAGPAADLFIDSFQVQYADTVGQWGSSALLGDYTFPGVDVLSALPASGMVFGYVPGVWTERTSAGARYWNAVASSADGTKIAAVVSNGYIYTSVDAGATWTERTSVGSRNWYAVAVSTDGTKIAAVVSNGYIYTSTDGGATWTERTSAGVRAWQDVELSADGTKIAAVVDSGYIYTSADGGATWTENTSSNARTWRHIASSSDGTGLAAFPYFGYIYTSADGGATWTERTSAGSRNWNAVASSADGTKIAAVVNGGYIYTSADGGATWTERTSAGVRAWQDVELSADGTRINAVAYSSYIYSYAARDPMFVAPSLAVTQLERPTLFASAPVPAFSVSELTPAIVWRDMEHAGRGRVTGTVKKKNDPTNIPLHRRVRLHRQQDGMVIRETWSDATTGAYTFSDISEQYVYYVVSFDYLHDNRAVIADNLTLANGGVELVS